MALVSLTLAKKHLRVFHDDDDAEIEAYLAAAEDVVTKYIDRAVYASADDSPPGAPPSGDDGTAIEISPAITAAVLLLLGDLYETREADAHDTSSAMLPRAVRALLAPYRVWRAIEEEE